MSIYNVGFNMAAVGDPEVIASPLEVTGPITIGGLTIDTDGNLSFADGAQITSPVTIGDADGAVEIGAGGVLSLSDDAATTVCVDLPVMVRSTGAGIPTQAAVLTGHTAPKFAINDQAECLPGLTLPGWDGTTALSVALEMICNGSEVTDSAVKWQVSLAYAAPDGAVTALTALTHEVTIAGDTPDLTRVVVPMGTATLTGTGLAAGTLLLATVKRIAATGGGDAPVGDPWCPLVRVSAVRTGL